MASLLLAFSALICMFSFSPAISQQINTYIVHVSSNADDTASSSRLENLESRYLSFLPKDTKGLSDAARLVHSYSNIIKGFAARLSADEAKTMEKMEGVLSVKPQRILSLQTTLSPNFLGLHENFGFWPSSNFGEGVIVGLLDTGITPGHPSFDDEGMPPPPAKWKGKCELDASACNKKLIGARNFVTEDTAQPIDDEGHGTHTASTAAGNFVSGANVFGNANGTAVGMAPRAHLAMYKVCSADGCAEVDMLAAMDAAVEEGVDVLSISIGGPPGFVVPFFTDNIAIGAFAAMQKGIFVSCAAGNSGPVNASLSNEAPWILTVGASTLDRNIRATVVLGNNDEFDGESLFQPISFSPNNMLPLVFSGQNGDPNATFCAPGSLNPADVQGKVVICDRGGLIGRIDKGKTVKLAGGAAMVLANQEVDGDSTLADAHVLPASHVGFAAGQAIKASMRTQTPTATISFKGTVIGIKSAPAVTSFSSRGPSLASPGILKPDIIGPGVSIIAAWNESVEGKINTAANFNIISGTSMATPHLSGIAALLKSVHPDWSPAAIKSAIMTTAELFNINSGPITDERRLPADVFAIGAGHVNPPRAADPGLIYDIQPDDYIPYLCGLGYKNKEITIITQRKVRCSRVKSIPEAQLNYPSFSIELGVNAQKTFTRTVTNVGAANSVYRPQSSSIPGVDVDIQPSALSFTEVKQQITYQVSFTRTDRSSTNTFVQGAITWVSGATRVRSPVSVLLT